MNALLEAWATPPAALIKTWLLLPFAAAFVAALLPSLGRALVLGSSLATALVGLSQLQGAAPLELEVLGPLGVALRLDGLAGWFLLLNGLLVAAVVLEGWGRPPPPLRSLLLLVLQGGLSVSSVATDLVSLYVTLELVGIAAFLLIVLPQREATLWVGLRYLLVSNTAMSLYLVGAALVYVQRDSFRIEALAGLPFGAPEVFLLIGLFTKAGLFLAGLWLPRTHAEAPAEISALLSGVVVTGGAVPLLRLAEVDDALLGPIRWVGLASAAFGVAYAFQASDVKRLLAWSTLSQMGLVVLSPLSGGALALAHGLAKGALFLSARRFPTRDLQLWSSRPLALPVWLVLWLASLSIAGVPPLAGYAAKKQLEAALPQPWAVAVLLVSVGTAAVYARLWGVGLQLPAPSADGPGPAWSQGLAMGVLVLPLLLGVSGLGAGWTAGLAALSAAAVLAAGILLQHWLRPWQLRALPVLERLDQLLGGAVVLGAGLLAGFAGGL